MIFAKIDNRLIIIVIKNQCPFCGKSLRGVPINSEEYCSHCGCKIEQEHKKIPVFKTKNRYLVGGVIQIEQEHKKIPVFKTKNRYLVGGVIQMKLADLSTGPDWIVICLDL
ncbi:hypothetical protein DWX80_18935 [Ruminococcus sp. AF21-3]|nr:hypothetical protein DWX80_18935 [Ruminococcus sp. AF21-3]